MSPSLTPYLSDLMPRKKTFAVRVGGCVIGGGAPILVQSMTNTDTADVAATVEQITALARAGSELVRITVDREEAAIAVPYIKEQLVKKGIEVPLAGDFHYIGHKLLEKYPACAQLLDKYRVNPGNVGFGEKKDKQFAQIIEIALRFNKPVRIGGNWGSLDQVLLTRLMNENAQLAQPLTAREVIHQALVQSVLFSADFAEKIGLPKDKIILSAKVSRLQDLLKVYTLLAQQSSYALHLGLTEAGMGSKGIVASCAALALLLQQGIGDTIRVSLTPEPQGDRCREVRVAQELLQAMELRQFFPSVTACPGCGRTTSTVFQNLADKIERDLRKNMALWREKYPGVEKLHVAVMGCIVNGPGESKFSDIGISLPGTGEEPAAPVFIEGKKVATLRGAHIAEAFEELLTQYIIERFGKKNAQAAGAVFETRY